MEELFAKVPEQNRTEILTTLSNEGYSSLEMMKLLDDKTVEELFPKKRAYQAAVREAMKKLQANFQTQPDWSSTGAANFQLQPEKPLTDFNPKAVVEEEEEEEDNADYHEVGRRLNRVHLGAKKQVSEGGASLHIGPASQQLNVIILGETGSGKSTLINYLTNHFLNGRPPNRLRIAIPNKYFKATEGYRSEEDSLEDWTVSKTKHCFVYRFRDSHNNQFNFIDSPGLSDTAGNNEDDRHVESIMSAAKEAGMLTAIILVVNGTNGVLTANMRNVIQRLRNTTPDELLKNVIVVLTKCRKSNAIFQLETLGSLKPKRRNVFYTDNSYLSQNPKTRDPDMEAELQDDWKKSMQVMGKLANRIKKLQATSTEVFAKMVENRDKIKTQIQEILMKIQACQQVEDQLEGARKAHPEIERSLEQYKDWKVEKEVATMEMEDCARHNTLCQVHKETICHEGCGLAYTTAVGDAIFKGCACMSKGPTCSQCECPHVNHFHAKKRPVKTTKTIEEILEDKKATWEGYGKQMQDLNIKITSFEQDRQQVQAKLAQHEEEIKRLCGELKQICTYFNFIDELYGVIEMLQTEKRSLRNQAARENAETLIRNIKALASELTTSTY